MESVEKIEQLLISDIDSKNHKQLVCQLEALEVVLEDFRGAVSLMAPEHD